jgi:peptide/nickel transport system permease protein
VLQGDLGYSFFQNKPVAELIAQRMEPTLSLAAGTMLLSVLIAVPLGTLAAWRMGGWLDRLLSGFAVAGFSIPVFVVGYVLIYVFAIQLHWLPVQGYRRLFGAGGTSIGAWAYQLVLPWLSLATIYVALIARVTRASVSEALTEDYIRTARAKGLHRKRGAAAPCAGQCGRAHRHRDRPGRGAADRRRGGHRDRLRHSRPGLAHGGRGAEPRLPGDPGRGAVLQRVVRAGEPAVDISYLFLDPRIRY